MAFGNLPPLLFLFINFSRVDEPAEPALRLVNPFVKLLGSKKSICAETSYAQRSWSAFLEQQVCYLVHPACAGEKENEKDRELDSSHNNSLIKQMSIQDKKPEFLSMRQCTSIYNELNLTLSETNAFVFGSYGFARMRGTVVLKRTK